jgi:hypothetical protein
MGINEISSGRSQPDFLRVLVGEGKIANETACILRPALPGRAEGPI